MSIDKIEGIFGSGGSLSKVLAPEYEWRPQQLEMARTVGRTLEHGGALLVEAPTGVGKSLSYLVPGILWAIRNDGPCVVSTYTKQLQDQILNKELPRLQRVIDRTVRIVVLKGRSSYLCRQRWDHFVAEQGGTVEGERVQNALQHWVDYTDTGDFADAPPIAPADLRVLERICSDDRFCATQRCKPETGCFYKLSRREAKQAHLVVVNHALLMTDLFGGRGGLPEFDTLIIDEAHHLERAAAQPLSFSVTDRSLELVLRALGGRGEPGVTDDLRKVARVAMSTVSRRPYLDKLRGLESETAEVIQEVRRFWIELQARPDYPGPNESRRYDPSSVPPIPESGAGLCRLVRSQVTKLQHALMEVREQFDAEALPRTETLALAEAERRLERVTEQVAQLEELITPTDRHRVYWIEAGAAGTERGDRRARTRGPRSDDDSEGSGELGIGDDLVPSGASAIRTVPLMVGRELQDRLFLKKRSVVLTSATLAVQGEFRHVAERLGQREGNYESLALASPFDLPKQVRAVVHTEMANPNQPQFTKQLAEGIIEITSVLRKKTLVLFTSHEALRRVAGHLREPLAAMGVRLLAQGMGEGRHRLRASFEESEPAVLLGAASFWEGVDFPGQDLEVLILARLPFGVPSDPVVQARSERAEAQGQNAFNDYYLPEAILRFRQGFGRLIRRSGDRGLFIVVDPRLHQRGYGAQFQRAVGVRFQPMPGWREIVSEGVSWFRLSDEGE